MNCRKSLLVGLAGTAAGLFVLSMAAASAQQAPQYPLDDKLASEPAPWTVPGKWGKRGNWGRWGEEDKRGMLNYITPDMVLKAAALVKQGKVYAPGEELNADVPRVITPARVGMQVILENDGYDRVADSDIVPPSSCSSWATSSRPNPFARSKGVRPLLVIALMSA